MHISKLTRNTMYRLLPVQVLLSLVGVINGIVSSLFAGNFVGVKAMTAVGLYAPVTQLIIALNIMLLSGSLILCGEYLGRNDHDKVQKVFSIDMVISGLFAVLVVIGHLVFWFSGSFTTYTEDPEVSRMLCKYVLGQALGIIPLVLGSQLSSFLSLENKNKRTMTASLSYIAVNFLFNYLFVAVMKLEALGLALAPAIGMWVYFLIQAPPFFSKKAIIRFSLKGLDVREAASIIKIGIPGAANDGYIALRGVIVNSLIMTFVGGVGISAFTAANSILSFFWQIPEGMVLVSRMMISVSVGEEDRKGLTDIMRVAFWRFIPFLFIMAAVIMLFAEPFTRIIYRDPSDPVYLMTIRGFQILPLCMPLSIVCTHFLCYFQATGKHILVHLMAILDGVIGVVAFTMLLIKSAGINGVYIANVLNGLIAIVVVSVYACYKKKGLPKNMDEFMALPSDFGVPEEKRMEVTMNNMESVIGVSEAVHKFCRKRNIDEHRAFLASLFLEEMAGNVVEHGFSADKRSHYVHICAACKKETLILSIKDDCIPFDFDERRKIMDPDDKTKNIGIRIVSGLASDIKHQNILGLNVMTIRLDAPAFSQ